MLSATPLFPKRTLTKTALALMTLLFVSCGGEKGKKITVQEDPRPTSISLTPSSVSFEALGESQQLSATVRDQFGNVMTGVSVGWTSDNPTVAVVNSTGMVTANGIGSASISASVGSASAVTTIAVTQVPAEVRVTPPAHTLEAIGATVQMSAAVNDANGHAITGLSITWASSDPDVVSIEDDTGIAKALTVGSATITASQGSLDGVGEIQVTPIPATLTLVSGSGQTGVVGEVLPQELVVEALDSNGHPVADQTISWSISEGSGSLGSASTTTDSDGRASAQWTLGTTAGAQSASATIADLPAVSFTASAIPGAPASVTVSPTEVSINVGESYPLEAVASDAYGNEIGGAEFSWTSVTPAIASVSSSGVITGNGVGEVVVSATVDDQIGAADITVLAAAAPILETVSPEVLVPGEVAALEGRNFGAVASSISVQVDGVSAEIQSVSETQIQFLVPDFSGSCTPRHAGTLVAQRNGSTSNTIQLEVEANSGYLDLEPGNYIVLRGNDQSCASVRGDTDGAEYLMIFQAYSPVEGVYGYSFGGLQGSQPSAAPLEVPPGPQRVRQPSPPTRDSLTYRQEFDLEQYEDFKAIVATQPELAEPAGPMAVPSVGQTRTFYTSESETITTDVVYVGSRVAIYLDQNAPVPWSPEALTALGSEFDGVIQPAVTGVYGPIPDLDADERTAVVFTPKVNVQGWPDSGCSGGVVGYVRNADIFSNDLVSHSNEADVFFAITPDPSGTFGCPFTEGWLVPRLRNTMAHELVHVIHVYQKYLATASYEDLWIMEGLAQMGPYYAYELLLGAGQTSRAQEYLENLFNDVAGFTGGTAPDVTAIVQRSGTANYGFVWLFASWLNHAFGSSALHDLIYSPYLSVNNVEQITGESFANIMAYFGLAQMVGGPFSGQPALELPVDVRSGVQALGQNYYLDSSPFIPVWGFQDRSFSDLVLQTSMAYSWFTQESNAPYFTFGFGDQYGNGITTEPFQVIVWRTK